MLFACDWYWLFGLQFWGLLLDWFDVGVDFRVCLFRGFAVVALLACCCFRMFGWFGLLLGFGLCASVVACSLFPDLMLVCGLFCSGFTRFVCYFVVFTSRSNTFTYVTLC